MYCTRRISSDLTWVGANDRRLAMFEGVYSVPDGVSYNSYLLTDEKTVLFDTVDKSVSRVFLENVAQSLQGRTLDYVIVQHMEPDHTATLVELLERYPSATIVCNKMAEKMLRQFYDIGAETALLSVDETTALTCGRHTLRFLMAPMVHWPEVMVTYDETDKILFSADAFGTFGALNGALFADEVDFMRDYLPEARRYYSNIVGKYGTQVQSLLAKASKLDIAMICPLHGFVWRKNIGDYVEKYQKWSTYTPEEPGVLIAYASIYGHTENAAEILACKLREAGIKTEMFDVSVKPASEIVSAAFRLSHIVLASVTYNAGIFTRMEDFLRDLAAHNIQNRTIAILENGSWAPTSGNLMHAILSECKNLTFLTQRVTIKSALHAEQLCEIDTLCAAILATFPKTASPAIPAAPADTAATDPKALFALSYGLFVVTAKEGGKDNGCIVNTAIQAANAPNRLALAINKANLTHDMVLATGLLNVSVLTEDAPFKVYQHFGFQSGRTVDKFADCTDERRSANGLLYIPKYTNAFFSGRVVNAVDCGSHTLFIADITESAVLSDRPSVTYAYYFAHVKPKPQPKAETRKGWVCKICGYVYEGEELPPDFICPICKHGAEDFEPIVPAPPKKKRWVCKICGYEYEGDVLPPDFICPLCKHPAEDFELVE